MHSNNKKIISTERFIFWVVVVTAGFGLFALGPYPWRNFGFLLIVISQFLLSTKKQIDDKLAKRSNYWLGFYAISMLLLLLGIVTAIRFNLFVSGSMLDRGLSALTTLLMKPYTLFAAWLFIIIAGYRSWRKVHNQQTEETE